METEMKVYYVIKVGDEYLSRVDEFSLFDEDVNYELDNLSEAIEFESKNSKPPKYLYDDKRERSIKTLKEACSYLNGEMVKIIKTTKWEESLD